MDIDTEKVVEKKELLKRCFSKGNLYRAGRELKIAYFLEYTGGWMLDSDQAAYKLAVSLSDEQLQHVFKNFTPYRWRSFYGKYYTYENGRLALEGTWEMFQTYLYEFLKKDGKKAAELLKALAAAPEGQTLTRLKEKIKLDELEGMLKRLEMLKVVETVYEGSGDYKEWATREEILPLVRQIAEGRRTRAGKNHAATMAYSAIKQPPTPIEEPDILREEIELIRRMDGELETYLADLFKNRLRSTLDYGRNMSAAYLAEYLKKLFGPVLYFDSFLALAQQYGLADVEVVHSHGKTGFRTGFNLSLFGEPGTGKSFSTRDMILGSPKEKLPAHGIPGRNRYTGGMTPARFIRIGQAYEGKVFNFIAPEFNDWFRYKGMVEVLKLAMERSQIRYETFKEVIGPYRFTSFFCVNYNTAVRGKSYEVTISDPNFEAIEDRMLCRLHRLTKERFAEIAKSRQKLAFGGIDVAEEAKKIRDHVTLVYAIETGHPMVHGHFQRKPVLLTHEVYNMVEKARNVILEHISGDTVMFSARLEDRAIRLAGAISLLSYFQSRQEHVPVTADALNFAVRFYLEEASVRSRGAFDPEHVFREEFERDSGSVQS